MNRLLLVVGDGALDVPYNRKSKNGRSMNAPTNHGELN